jgi:hypothetical protein
MITSGDRDVNEGGCGFSEPWVGEKIPDGRVGVGDRGDHHKSERGKLANISARFRSISSADGAGPYFASSPRKDNVGSFRMQVAGASAMSLSTASRTKSFAVTPLC